ncbi:Rossmann-like domain-containing protein, partial [Dyella sp.]
MDAYDAAEIRPGQHVVVVGAFVPFLKALKRAGAKFTVLEI